MKRNLLIVLSCLLLLILFLSIRGCGKRVPEPIYQIGRDLSWYPMNFMGKEKNLSAFTDDLLFAIASKERFRVQLISIGSGGLESGLDRGEFDAIVTTEEPTVQKRERYIYSEPFFYLGPVLIVKNDSKAESIKDMKDKRVGILTSSTVFFEATHNPSVIMQTYTSRTQALEDLAKGEIDGLIMELIPAYSYIEGLYKGALKIVGETLTDQGLRLQGSRATAKSLIKQFDQGLHLLKSEHRLDELMQRWELFNPPEPHNETQL